MRNWGSNCSLGCPHIFPLIYICLPDNLFIYFSLKYHFLKIKLKSWLRWQEPPGNRNTMLQKPKEMNFLPWLVAVTFFLSELDHVIFYKMSIFGFLLSIISRSALIWNPWTSLKGENTHNPILTASHLLSFCNCENLCLSFKFHLFSFQWVDVEQSVNLMLNSRPHFGILANWRHMAFHPYLGLTASSLFLTHFLLKALKIAPNMCVICI